MTVVTIYQTNSNIAIAGANRPAPILMTLYQETSTYSAKWIISDFVVGRQYESPPFQADGKDFVFILEYDQQNLILKLKSHTKTFLAVRVYLRLENRDPKKSINKNMSSCTFSAHNIFNKLMDIKKNLLTEENGWINNECLTVYIEICFKDRKKSTQLLTIPSTSEKLSKSNGRCNMTPYCGLNNTSSLCYLNSYIQVLFHLPIFRKLIYSIDTTNVQDEEKSIPLNLQQLFCDLQFSTSNCSTERLTKSFGWDEKEIRSQKDIQEFSLIFGNRIREFAKESSLEKQFEQLFVGKELTIFECENSCNNKETVEDFLDLPMTIIDCKDLCDSFKKYMEEESFDNFATDECGKVKAKKYNRFQALPSILQFHLLRFHYSPQSDKREKISKLYAFPVLFNLPEYKDGKQVDIKYDLFSVIAHSGSADSGHYVAFIKVGGGDKWYKFNDSSVSEVCENDAVQGNFGGDHLISAYLLIYVKNSDKNEIFAPITLESIPEHLKQYLKKKEEEKKKREMEDKFITFKFKLEDDLNAKSSFFDEDIISDKTLKVERNTLLSDLYAKVGELFKGDPKSTKIRIWREDANNSILAKSSSKKIEEIFPLASEVTLFLQIKGEREYLIPLNMGKIILTYIFNPDFKQPIHYVGSITVYDDDFISTVIQKANKLFGFPEDTKLIVFKKMDKTVEKVNPKLTIKSALIFNGRFLIFQVSPDSTIPHSDLFDRVERADHHSTDFNNQDNQNNKNNESNESNENNENSICNENDKDIYKLNVYNAFSVLPELDTGLFDSYISQKYYMSTVDVYRYYPQEARFTLQYPLDLTLSDLKRVIINIEKDSLEGFDPDKDSIVLYKHDIVNNVPYYQSSKSTIYNSTVRYLMVGGIIYYHKVKNVSETEIMTKTIYKLQFAPDGYNVSFTGLIPAPESSTVEKLLAIAKEREGVDLGDGPFRMFQVSYSKPFERIFLLQQEIKSTFSTRVDKLIKPLEGEVSVEVCHALFKASNFVKCVDDPFYINLRNGMKAGEVKELILQKLIFKKGDISKIKLAKHIGQNITKTYKDNEIIDDLKENSTLFLKHSDKNTEMPSQRSTKNTEKSIVIYN